MSSCIQRRRFLQHVALAGTLAAAPRWARADPPSAAQYLPAANADAPLTQIDQFKKRAPFGWHVGGIPPVAESGDLLLRWTEAPVAAQPARLRLCVLDTREPRNPVDAVLCESGRTVGTFDLQWVGQFQVHEIRLSLADAQAVQREGVRLRQQAGTQPVWIVTGTGSGPDLPAALQPHLLLESATNPESEFLARMNSLACVQPFGWMEGCVLDGLRDLALRPAYGYFRRALHAHLALFFKPDGRLVYENARGEPVNDRTSGIESTLPFAALAWEQPEHPALEIALKFWRSAAERDPQSCIVDGGSTTSEGAYTVGYPLAVAARQRGDRELAHLALAQVMVRQTRLFDGEVLSRSYSLRSNGQPSLGNRNWCRGVAWQFLGLTRTLIALDGLVDISAGREQARRLADWVVRYQLPGGLWSVFLHEPKLLPDTSGSAGIAAALALGHRQGWFDAAARDSAVRCLAGLTPHLTPDGFLGGASQSNKGGEALQRGTYRVIYQMGMGLHAQLLAALADIG